MEKNGENGRTSRRILCRPWKGRTLRILRLVGPDPKDGHTSRHKSPSTSCTCASSPVHSVAVPVCVRWVLTHSATTGSAGIVVVVVIMSRRRTSMTLWRRSFRIVGTRVCCVFRPRPVITPWGLISPRFFYRPFGRAVGRSRE
jgi:hypothetical protein